MREHCTPPGSARYLRGPLERELLFPYMGLTRTSRGSTLRSGKSPNSVQKNMKCLKHVLRWGAMPMASKLPKKEE
eukprot:scaffold111812_cov40-Attheya_sp.AAC.1